MTEGVAHNDRLLSASEFFSRARKRLTFDVPAGLADPNVIPRHDELDTDPAVIAAIAAVRPIRPAAVLVPIIERDELSVLFTERTAHLADQAGQISFSGGKIDVGTKVRPQPRCVRPKRRLRFAAALSSRSSILTFISPLQLSYDARAGARTTGLCASAEP